MYKLYSDKDNNYYKSNIAGCITEVTSIASEAREFNSDNEIKEELKQLLGPGSAEEWRPITSDDPLYN